MSLGGLLGLFLVAALGDSALASVEQVGGREAADQTGTADIPPLSPRRAE